MSYLPLAGEMIHLVGEVVFHILISVGVAVYNDQPED